MLLDVNRGQDVVLHEALRQDDRVLVVVALPRHEGNEQVAPKCHLAVFGAGAVGEDLGGLDPLTLFHDRALVEARALVGATELLHPVGAVGAVVLSHSDRIGGDLGDDATAFVDDHVAGVGGGTVFHAGADERRLATQQRNRLALHVGTHECAVGVVVLEERDHRCRDRHHLARRDVHVVDGRARHVVDLSALGADQDARVGKQTILGERGVCLRDDGQVLLVSGEVVDLVGDPSVGGLAVGSLDEAERIDAGERGEGADETDVGSLRRLDRTHAAVVRRVDIADLEAGTLTRETARAERREATLVRQSGERVGLVHELRELAGAEELLDGGDDRPDVDERLRRDGLDVLGRHALAHNTLHAGQARTDLVLDQLAHGAQTTVSEVVDVVCLDSNDRTLGCRELGLQRVQTHEVFDRRDDVLDGDRALRQRERGAQLLVDLVAPDLGQVIALGVEVEVVEQRLASLGRRGFARTQLAVDVLEGLVLLGDAILLEGGHHRLIHAEALANLVHGHAEGLQQHGDRLLALAVDTDTDEVLLIDLELQPRTA